MAVSLALAAFGTEDKGHAALELARWAQTDWAPRQDDVATTVVELPRTYAGATKALRGLIAAAPDLLLLLDTDPTSTEWKLHVLAANYDDDARPDADAVTRHDAIIDPAGPVAYRSRLPLDGLWDKFLVERVPVRMSHKAGGHVFNHAFYTAMHEIARAGHPTLAGAVETPPLGGPTGRPRAQLVDEMAMVLAVLVQLYPAALKEQAEAAGRP